MDENKWKNIAYSKIYVEIEQTYEKKIGVFARWFVVDNIDRSLVLQPMQCQGYIDGVQYHLMIPAPEKNDKKFIFSEEVFGKINPMLLQIS